MFAADVTGDAHALDRSTVLGSLVASRLPSVAGTADLTWRDKWARVGVVCDEVSVSVLVLNLPLAERSIGPVSTAVSEHREAGIPLRLTLQQLRAEALSLAPGALVRSCENPSVVVQATSTLGAESAPLVCTDGQPNSAVDALMRQASTSGARFAHHGDFDWGGIHIANHLIARYEVGPWRFSTPDYLAAVAVGRMELGAPRRPVSASWDPDLVPAMQSDGRRVFEEQVLADLIADLGS